MSNHFVIPGGFKKWSMGLMIVGAVALLIGIFTLHPGGSSHGDDVNSTRFWAVLLQNSVFWLLLVNVSMFFISIHTLAWGAWQVAFKRVTEAISAVVPIMGVLTLIIILSIVFGHRYDIYPWLDKTAVASDKALAGKSGFLNPTFFILFSIITL
jgi:hypothetical protein